MIQKEIIYFGKRTVLACDGLCNKAWGINGRPRHRLVAEDEDPDDYVWLGDEELGTAPPPGKTVGLSDGGHIKPSAVAHSDLRLLNKWCARECERSALINPGKSIVLPDMRNPTPNIPIPIRRKHRC